MHGEESSVRADKGYITAECETALMGPNKVWGVMHKATKGSPLHPLDAQINRVIAMVEHPFRAIKCQFGHVTIRYRSIAKNRAHLFTSIAPTNLFLVRRRLMT